MMKKAISLALLFGVILSVNAQKLTLDQIFNKYYKSVVKVEVTDIPGKDPNVCSGFLWKDTKHVVTSLHAMSSDPSAKIWVIYLDKYSRQAKVIKVLVKADLVLLEILPDKNGNYSVPEGVTPLNNISTNKIASKSDIFAFGYNHGAPRTSSRYLTKGVAAPPETLEGLIPPDDAANLSEIGFPTLDLEILYLDGNLLPGYSGSPAFDDNGNLIGIGDGGLKGGQKGVSWVIPAKFLAELESSPVTKLPPGITASDKHFTSSVPRKASAQYTSSDETIAENSQDPYQAEESKEVDYSGEEEYNTESNEDDEETDYWEIEYIIGYEGYEETYYEEYVPLEANGFEFYMTLNSSLVEMAETADDPEHLYSFANELEGTNVKLDYNNLRFDIYEDINYGVILAVPEGDELYYDPEAEIFQVNYDENPDVDLYFTGVAGDFSQTDFNQELSVMFDWVPPMMAEFWGVGGFTINDGFSYMVDVDGYRKIAYILMHSEKVQDEYGLWSNINLYITILMSQEKSFMAVASYNMNDENFRIAREFGVDCVNWQYNAEYCSYFESIFKVFCASHLTTFAY